LLKHQLEYIPAFGMLQLFLKTFDL
jgi:hypothetical protein